MATVNISPKKITAHKSDEAKGHLRWVALFLGELRDGLTMINMQSAYLIVSKGYSEKQAGVLFFVFGMSQFIFQTPAGYLMDYSDRKVLWLGLAGVATTILTIVTAVFAADNGSNLALMIFVKFLQGSITSLIPPGLNSITQGIVGAVGMTKQVSLNEMMNHMGTALIVLTASLLAYALYPNFGYLFIMSPIFCVGMVFFLSRIKPEQIDHDAARGLTTKATPDSDLSPTSQSASYKAPMVEDEAMPVGGRSPKGGNSTKKKKDIHPTPSFNFGFGQSSVAHEPGTLVAETPLHVLRDPVLVTFTFICFLFHTANGCVLPLVMQSLALEGGRSSMLMSGLCIIIAQILMVFSAKICGEYSTVYGRKVLFLIGLFSVGVRCLILTFLLTVKGNDGASFFLQCLILSTQILDGVGAGVFGTMYILVTSDISAGTGRFSFTLGITTAAMNIGGTVSGYLGEHIAQELGYKPAFMILGALSLIPAILYLVFMPETLPSYTKTSSSDAMQKVTSLTSIAEAGACGESHKESIASSAKDESKYVELV